MKKLYQVQFHPHCRSAKTKASIASVGPHVWSDRYAYDKVVAVLAESEDEAGKLLTEEILPHDDRPLSCLSYLRSCAVKTLKVGQEVVTPPHGRWFEDLGDDNYRDGKWTRGVVAEILGDDPANALVGIHMFRDVRRNGETVREWYVGSHGEKITVDFPVRQLAKIR